MVNESATTARAGAPAGVTVIVPVLGDSAALARLLPALRALQPPPAAILVADGAASSECRTLCARHGAMYLATRAGRGHQQHVAAGRALSPTLWFVHADAEVPCQAIAVIEAAVARGAVGGCFRFRFTGPPAWYKSALATLINLRAKIGVPYGDQGLFVRADAYARAGGFPDVPLFEEVPLVKALRRAGRFAILDTALGVSPRRWERDGWLRRTLENRLLALGYMAGVPPARLARRYRAADPAAAPVAQRPGE